MLRTWFHQVSRPPAICTHGRHSSGEPPAPPPRGRPGSARPGGRPAPGRAARLPSAVLLIVDLDGVVYRGEVPVPGMPAAARAARGGRRHGRVRDQQLALASRGLRRAPRAMGAPHDEALIVTAARATALALAGGPAASATRPVMVLGGPGLARRGARGRAADGGAQPVRGRGRPGDGRRGGRLRPVLPAPEHRRRGRPARAPGSWPPTATPLPHRGWPRRRRRLDRGRARRGRGTRARPRHRQAGAGAAPRGGRLAGVPAEHGGRHRRQPGHRHPGRAAGRGTLGPDAHRGDHGGAAGRCRRSPRRPPSPATRPSSTPSWTASAAATEAAGPLPSGPDVTLRARGPQLSSLVSHPARESPERPRAAARWSIRGPCVISPLERAQGPYIPPSSGSCRAYAAS